MKSEEIIMLGTMSTSDGTFEQVNRVHDVGGCSPTITTREAPKVLIHGKSKDRIRRLTPKECWHLMNFDDQDYERAAEENSEGELYKQAGNSIVVNVLVALFGQMIPDKEHEYKK